MTWPITVDEAKAHSYISITDEDDLITDLIGAACEGFEQITSMALVSTQYTESWSSWPGRLALSLPRWPLVSVASLAYVDSDGDTQTVSADDYWVDTQSQPGLLWMNYGASWPSATLRPGPSITATYTAGYADADAVPDLIKRTLLIMFADLYEHREETVVQPGVSMATLDFVRNQMRNWRRVA